MADSKKAFLQRVISALLAAVLVLAAGIYGHTSGLILVCTVVIVLTIREYTRMAFRLGQMPSSVSHAYWAICLLTFIALFYFQTYDLQVFALGSGSFFAASLWLARGKVANEALLASLAIGAFGLIYCVLFPYFCIRLLQLPDGAQWFLFLLLVVFFGDTFAYFSGRWFGRTKFMPLISPKKTWEGSLGGLFGSAVAGTVHISTFQNISIWQTFLFCLGCGFAAQTGDLLISLVKRVAQVKDSGSIMPGHGGVLDRIDGVLIACPLVYSFALYAKSL